MTAQRATIFLVRHCHPSGQEADAALTAEGHRQAEALAFRLAAEGLQRIVCSPYARAVQSAEPLAWLTGLAIETDARLVERSLSKMPVPNWRERLAATFLDLDLCLPGGESSRAAISRGVAALADVLAGGPRVAAIVTHGNLLALLLKSFDDSVGFAAWEALTYPDVYRLVFAGESPSVERVVF
jgi:2,3-bisphosphoglycerate-dependent phosphoglycerate mutase